MSSDDELITVIYGDDCHQTKGWVKHFYDYFTVEDINNTLAVYIEDIKVGLDNLDDFEAFVLENIRSTGEDFLSFIFKCDFKDIDILDVKVTNDYQVKYLVRRPP